MALARSEAAEKRAALLKKTHEHLYKPLDCVQRQPSGHEPRTDRRPVEPSLEEVEALAEAPVVTARHLL